MTTKYTLQNTTKNPEKKLAYARYTPLYVHFYHGPDFSRAMVMWPPIRVVTHSLIDI